MLSGVKFKISGSVVPFVGGKRYLSNGDPGYPDEGGFVEDLTVKLVKPNKKTQKEETIDITDFLSESMLDDLHNYMLNYHSDRD